MSRTMRCKVSCITSLKPTVAKRENKPRKLKGHPDPKTPVCSKQEKQDGRKAPAFRIEIEDIGQDFVAEAGDLSEEILF